MGRHAERGSGKNADLEEGRRPRGASAIVEQQLLHIRGNRALGWGSLGGKRTAYTLLRMSKLHVGVSFDRIGPTLLTAVVLNAFAAISLCKRCVSEASMTLMDATFR